MSRSLAAAIILPLLLGSSIACAQTPAPQGAPTGGATPKPAEPPPAAAPGGSVKMFATWALICAPASGSSEKSCEVDATLRPDAESPPVAKVAFVRGAKDQPVRLVAIVAANLTLKNGVEVASDPAKPGIMLTFKSCLNSACLADVSLTQEQLQGFHTRKTLSGRLSIKNAGGQPLSLAVPLQGLDEALNALAAQQN